MNDKLITYIKDRILNGRGEVALTPEDDLLGSGLVDSMGIMKLIAYIEEEFDVQVPPNDMIIENFMSVNAINDYLQRRKTRN